MNDVRFSVPVEKALNSPVTELAVLTVKDTTDSAQFEKVGNELIQKIFEHLPDEVIAGGRGAIDGKPKQFIVCLGWYSLEVSLGLYAQRICAEDPSVAAFPERVPQGYRGDANGCSGKGASGH